MNNFKFAIVRIFFTFRITRLYETWQSLLTEVKVMKYRKQGIHLNFVPQGGYRFDISGDLSMFSIHETSHIKSDTFIECSGGVSIGRFFHTGRGLTIFSTKHIYKEANTVPYGLEIENAPVLIGDCVWAGVNVTILPGSTIGDGAILGAGAVVRGNIPKGAIVIGNPCLVIGYRDMEHFNEKYAASNFV